MNNDEVANTSAVEALMHLPEAGKFATLVTNTPKTPSAITEQLRAKSILDKIAPQRLPRHD